MYTGFDILSKFNMIFLNVIFSFIIIIILFWYNFLIFYYFFIYRFFFSWYLKENSVIVANENYTDSWSKFNKNFFSNFVNRSLKSKILIMASKSDNQIF